MQHPHRDIDPSLRAAEAPRERLDDGFSPVLAMTHNQPTHPVEPDPSPQETDRPAGNPTQLPVEPEFGEMQPPAEPEDPGVSRPRI